MLRCSVLCGFVLAFLATAAVAQPPGGGFGFGMMRMPPTRLLRMAEVQKELNITDAQKPKLDDLLEELQSDAQSAMSGFDFQAIRDMSPEERNTKMSEIRAKTDELNKQSEPKIAKVLDENQMKRLKQLQIQQEGSAAFTRPEVVAKLNLTDDQKAKIKKLQDDAMAQMRSAFNPDASQEERQAARAKMQESRAKTLKDIVALLNSDQAKTWSELTGKEFKFPPFRGFGGGRGPTN
jgi:Spy/CpxP family protein refolding chaperone